MNAAKESDPTDKQPTPQGLEPTERARSTTELPQAAPDQQTRPGAPGRPPPAPKVTRRRKQNASGNFEHSRSVEDIHQIEKNRLVIWLTKFAAITTAVISLAFLGALAYVAYSTQALPSESTLLAFFDGFKEIVLIILGVGQ
jgi:hypothetical protein